jgi:hypothetical protein
MYVSLSLSLSLSLSPRTDRSYERRPGVNRLFDTVITNTHGRHLGIVRVCIPGGSMYSVASTRSLARPANDR